MVYEHSPIRSTVSALHKSHCSGNDSGYVGLIWNVVLLIPRVTVTPLSDGKDTPETCRDILS